MRAFNPKHQLQKVGGLIHAQGSGGLGGVPKIFRGGSVFPALGGGSQNVSLGGIGGGGEAPKKIRPPSAAKSGLGCVCVSVVHKFSAWRGMVFRGWACMGGLLYFLLVSSSKIVGFESKQDFKNTRIFTFFPFLDYFLGL